MSSRQDQYPQSAPEGAPLGGLTTPEGPVEGKEGYWISRTEHALSNAQSAADLERLTRRSFTDNAGRAVMRGLPKEARVESTVTLRTGSAVSLAMGKVVDAAQNPLSNSRGTRPPEGVVLGFFVRDDPNPPANRLQAIARRLTGRDGSPIDAYLWSNNRLLRVTGHAPLVKKVVEGDGGQTSVQYTLASKAIRVDSCVVLERDEPAQLPEVEDYRELFKNQAPDGSSSSSTIQPKDVLSAYRWAETTREALIAQQQQESYINLALRADTPNGTNHLGVGYPVSVCSATAPNYTVAA